MTKCLSLDCERDAAKNSIKNGIIKYRKWCYRCMYKNNINYKRKVLFQAYKTSARKRGLEFSIDKKYYIKLCDSRCFYCGGQSDGIDRKDNNLGYIKGNCFPCCTICNKMKSNRAESEFLDHIDLVYTFQHKYE